MLTILALISLALTLVSSQQVTITSECLLCICQSLGTCDYLAGCVQGSSGLQCGPLQLTEAYWIDAGRPGSASGLSFEQCANNRACAEQTVSKYIGRFAADCDQDQHLTCADFAILHRTGRSACHVNRVMNTHFWKSFKQSSCYKQIRQPSFNDGNRHNRDIRRTFDTSSNLASGPLEIFRSLLTGTSNTFNPFHTNLNSLSNQPAHGIRPASRIQPLTSINHHHNPANVPNRNNLGASNFGSLRVVNHFDRPIGFSGPIDSNRLSNRYGDIFNRNRGWINDTRVQISNQCLQCICDASTGCDGNHRCSGQFCGPYLISWPYWHDAGSLGRNFLACANDINCSRDSVRSYMRRNAQDCDSNGQITCDDYAVIHQLGGGSCSAGYEQVRKSLYWTKFRRCMIATLSSPVSDGDNRNRDLNPPRNSLPIDLHNNRHPTSVSTPSSAHVFSVEDRPEEDNGNDLNDFRESRRNSNSDEWRPMIITNRLSSTSRPILTRSTVSTSVSTESFTTPSTTRRPMRDYTRHARPGPRAFEIISESQPSTSTPVPRYSSTASFRISEPIAVNDIGSTSVSSFVPSVHPLLSTYHSSISPSPSPSMPSSAPPSSPMPSLSSTRLSTIKPTSFTSTQSSRSSHSNVLPVSSRSPFNVTVEPSCLNCICESVSGCDLNVRCRTNEFGEYVCGPFALNRFFWTEAGRPGDRSTSDSFESCATNRACAQQTIQSYVNRYPIDCNDDGTIDCLDIAALARLGKAACTLHTLLDSNYWNKFQQCYGFGDD